jgi:Tfp pilus assembly protein FimT
VVLCIILAVAVPNLKGFLTGSMSRDAATQLVALTQYARAKSAADAKTYRLSFDVANGEYYLTTLDDTGSGEFVPLGSDFGRIFSLPQRMTVEVQRPNTVRMSILVTANSDYIEFHPDGTCDPAVIRLTDGDGIVTFVAAPSPAEPFRIMTAQEVDAI